MRLAVSTLAVTLCVVLAPGQLTAQYIAYEVAEGTAGNQNFGGSTGKDFDVAREITVTRLGVFDASSDGLFATLTARLYDRSDTETPIAELSFSTDEPGELVGGSRFKALGEALVLPAGFEGTIVADGYNADELLGNGNVVTWTTDDGNCAISFVGGGRWGDAGGYPMGGADNGPVNRYASGTFEFEAPGETPLSSGAAYVVETGIAGNQAFGGTLGMDFDAEADIDITHLGVFDDGSDGLNLTITARLFDRDSQAELASAVFTPEDAGELIGGSRFKELAEPVSVPAGFHGLIAASGYGEGETLVNRGVVPGVTTDSHGCLIAFVGTGRWGVDPALFPDNVNSSFVANPFGAGTFQFGPAETAPPIPGAPTDLTATADVDGIALSWLAPTDGDADPVGYNVYRTLPASAGEMVRLNVDLVADTAMLVSDVLAGVESCFVVRAVGPTDLEGESSNEACAVVTTDAEPILATIAYQVPEGTMGNQDFAGAVGMDFEVRRDIVVSRLGVFDDGSDGLLQPITARLWDLTSQAEIATLEFTPDEPGELVGGSRFKDLALPILLPAGFRAAISAEGYGLVDEVGEQLGNQSVAPLGLSTDNADCAIYFLGSRYGDAGAFPAAFNGALIVDPYAAGTLVYGPLDPPSGEVPTDGIAYVVPEGTIGVQAFGGPVGNDFHIRERIVVTRLGVCDSGSDGLALPLTARLWDRTGETPVELAAMEFTPEDAGELIGGSRFKDLPEPILLRGGFDGTITGQGYGAEEPLANGGNMPITWTTDDGGCRIEFVGGGRWGNPGPEFPPNPDTGPANRFASGTFAFEAATCPEDGDTHCVGLTIEGPEDGGAGTYTATADATDDSNDVVLYTFTIDGGVDAPLVIGPQAENSIAVELDVGEWLIVVSVDDDADCDDVADDAGCDPVAVIVRPPSQQVPGDCNQDGTIDISDASCIFGVLFLGAPPQFPCGDGSTEAPGNIALIDWQPDGAIDLSDGVAALQFLFAGGPAHVLAVPGSEVSGCVTIAGCPNSSLCP